MTEPNYPTAEQIAEWKKLHGDLFKVTVGSKQLIFRKPTLKELDAAYHAQRSKGFGLSAMLYNCCAMWKSAEPTQPELLGIYSQLNEVIEVKEAQIAKI